MPVYWLSFRIADRNATKGTYDERYGHLMDVLGAYTAPSHAYWQQTTSFRVFNSEAAITDIAEDLAYGLSRVYDHFLIREMESKIAYIFGKNTDPEIFKLMQHGGNSYLRQIR